MLMEPLWFHRSDKREEMRDVIAVTLSSDEEEEDDQNNEDSELLLDWRGRPTPIPPSKKKTSSLSSSSFGVGGGRRSKRRSSGNRKTPAKKFENDPEKPSLLILDDTPVTTSANTLSNSKPSFSINLCSQFLSTLQVCSDGPDPVCLDSDSETNHNFNTKQEKEWQASDDIGCFAPQSLQNISEANNHTPSLPAENSLKMFETTEKDGVVTASQEMPHANGERKVEFNFSKTLSKEVGSSQSNMIHTVASAGMAVSPDLFERRDCLKDKVNEEGLSLDIGAFSTEEVDYIDSLCTNSAGEEDLEFSKDISAFSQSFEGHAKHSMRISNLNDSSYGILGAPDNTRNMHCEEDFSIKLGTLSPEQLEHVENDLLRYDHKSACSIDQYLNYYQDADCYKENHQHNGVDESLIKKIDGTQNDNNKIQSDNEQRMGRYGEISKKKKEKEEGRIRQREERRLRKEEERKQKEALKAELDEQKKHKKELEKWGKGKYALKAISAEIDVRVVEKGLIAGHLLKSLTEKGFSYHIASNPIKSSILWKMKIPDEENLSSFKEYDISYVAVILDAEEFCNMTSEGSLKDHIITIQRTYPGYNICYITNKLMSYAHKREQEKYKDPSCKSNWSFPPIEETLALLSTHFLGVRSRVCLDEAEVAEHIVGLTRSLAVCRFRQKLSHLTVSANGSHIPKDCVNKHMVKNNLWLKVLIAIPKLPPKCAVAICKKFPTMRSLLNIYLDPHRTVNEKEFLLQDLITEGPLGDNGRRLGPACSKRVYRIFMAQSGNLKTDDVEDGADLFRTV